MHVVSVDYRACQKATTDGSWHEMPFGSNLHAIMWDYYAAIETEPFLDLSFQVHDNGGQVLGFALANSAGGKLAYFGQPITVSISAAADAPDDVAATMVQHMLGILDREDLAGFELAEFDEPTSILKPWQLMLLNRGCASRTRFLGLCDVRKDETAFRRDLRKSYKSLINFGKREISLHVMDHSNSDPDLFRQFQEFHARIAGRQTRPQASWDAMLQLIEAGSAELIVGTHNDQMVACSHIFYDETTALYGTGVYERDLFSKPISHWPVFFSMLRAAERGNRIFNLGDVYVPGEADRKVRNIAYFKKGFAPEVTAQTIWSMPDQQDEANAP